MFGQQKTTDKQRLALCALAEISNQDERMPSSNWTKKDQVKKNRLQNKDRDYRASLNIQKLNAENIKPQKLPMIIAKNNLTQNNTTFIQSNNRSNNYILFQKGLGPCNTINFNRKKGRYLEENSKFIKLYSENSQQEIDMVRQWLIKKKQTYKQYNSILSKRKKSAVNEQAYRCLSIKNIL